MNVAMQNPNFWESDAQENTSARREYFGNNPSNNDTVTIFIGNIPQGLEEEGLRTLLMKCAGTGRPVSIRITRDSEGRRMAFVDFATITEATQAIQDLNGKQPFNLRVEIAKNKARDGRNGMENMVPQFSTPLSRPPSDNQPQFIRSVGRGAGARRNNQIYRTYKTYSQGRAVNDGSAWSPGPGDIYDAEKYMHVPRNEHEETNLKVLNSLQMTTRSDGRRSITMGRGYYTYSKRRPTSGPNQSAPSQKYYHTESNGVYSFNEDVQAPSTPCTRCKKPTVKKCTECGAHYCSEDCQGKDWQNHRKECKFKLVFVDVTPDGINGDKRTVSMMPLSEPIEPEVKAEPSELQASSRPRTSVIDTVIQDTQIVGAFEICKCSPDTKTIYGTLCCTACQEELSEVLLNLPKAISNMPSDQNISLVENTTVAVWYQEGWWRGVIMTASPQNDEYRVGLIDMAKIVTVKKSNIKPLPDKFLDLIEFGVKGTIIDSHVQENDLWSRYLQVKNVVRLHVEGVEGSSLVCNVKSEEGDNVCKMNFQRWSPEAQLKENQAVQVTPGCHVVLTSYHHQHALFVRPTGRNHVELRNTVLQQVAASHITGTSLNRAPRRDEMVACKCVQDGNFYRAVVREANAEGKYKVWFVDFGNTAEVGVGEMKLLPKDVKSHPFLAVKLSLRDVSDYKLTTGAAEFLNKLLEKEQVMTVQFENTVDEGVHLYTQDGTHVNKELNSLLQPAWKTATKSDNKIYGDKIFTVEDLVCLPLIENNKTEIAVLTAIVLLVKDDDEGTIFCCPANSPVVPEVMKSLSSQITEFCESSVSSVSYNPRKHEMCLARHSDGSWQRALAVEATEGGSRVVFLDVGGSEDARFKDMRRILPDFVQMPTLVSACSIKGLPEKLSQATKDKLNQLILPNTIINLYNVKEKFVGVYEIELPEVLSALRDQNLIDG